jgi:NAD(P)H-dependent FMN reductase
VSVVKLTGNFLGSERPLHLLGVSGSLHDHSRSVQALQVVLDAAAQRGAEVRLLDLREVELPLFRPDREGHSGFADRIAEDMDWADAVVLSSPDYHGSMSGALKNFLDYVWAECAGKLFGYICTSHEKGLTVMDQMRTAVRQCYGWSMPYGASIDGRADFDADGRLKNERVEYRLAMMARDIVVYGALVRRQFVADLAGTEKETFAANYRPRTKVP